MHAGRHELYEVGRYVLFGAQAMGTACTCRHESRLRVCAVKRRHLSSGCKPHPASAPAGSNRSSYGGNEVAEAFG